MTVCLIAGVSLEAIQKSEQQFVYLKWLAIQHFTSGSLSF